MAILYGFRKLQVCISFALHRGFVVIPKSVTSTRIAENFESTKVKLDPEDMRRLRDIDRNIRLLSVRTIILYLLGALHVTMLSIAITFVYIY